MTILRYYWFIGVVFLLTPVSAGAFEVPYQKIVEQRGARIVANTYGEGDPQYALCALDRLTCEGAGTSTPDLFPELAGKEYVLSSDRTYALTWDGVGDLRRYTLHALGSTPVTQVLLDFTGATRKIQFSEDNAKILFVTTRGEFIVFDIKTNSAIKSIPISGGASFITFSPRGNYIAYYSPNTTTRTERTYTLVDVTRDHIYTWKEKNGYWDQLSEEEKLFDFSFDERYFLYLGDRDGAQTLYVTRLALLDGVNGRLGRRIFRSNFTVNNFLFGKDGLLYVTANKKNPLVWSLYSYDLTGQSMREVSDNVLYWPPPQRVGTFIVFLRSKNELPALYAVSTETRAVMQLPIPQKNGPFFIASGTIKNFSGRYGVLYTPDGYEKKKSYPLIIWLHGGPSRQTSPSFHSYRSYGTYDAMLEYLRKNGFVILKLDYRGSYGYGKKFAEDLKGNVGNLDVKDVVDATTALKKEMRIEEVYPMGTSYGGYLALRALAGKPSLFSGAVSVNGVTDWWTLIKNDLSSIFKVHFNGPPSSKNKILYDQASIFLRLNKLKDKKIILVNGAEDVTVPHRQTTMLYDALVERGIDATIISYENEGHVLSNSANLDDLCNRVVALPSEYGGKTCVLTR